MSAPSGVPLVSGTGASASGRAEGLQRLRDQYEQRVTLHVRELVDALQLLMSASRVSERVENEREELQVRACAASMTRACEQLLHLVGELRHTALGADVAGIVTASTEHRNDALLLATTWRAQSAALAHALDDVL